MSSTESAGQGPQPVEVDTYFAYHLRNMLEAMGFRGAGRPINEETEDE